MNIGFGNSGEDQGGQHVRHRAARGCAGLLADHGDACAHRAATRCSSRRSGTQEDEVKSDFTLVPPGTTLEQAVGLAEGAGEVAEGLADRLGQDADCQTGAGN
jgi:hypothetical protein